MRRDVRSVVWESWLRDDGGRVGVGGEFVLVSGIVGFWKNAIESN